MDMLVGLLCLTGYSLFLARWLRRPSAIMPLVSVAGTMLWFTLLGCFGMLRPAGWLWYAAGLGALVFVIVKEKRSLARLFSPGLVLFLAGGAAFILLFYTTRPLLTQWDEFTFWGTAAKVVTGTNQLYTTAQSNLLAKYSTPSLIVFSYAMQFFGGAFAEYKFIAAYALVYLAAFAVPTALWRKNRTGAVILAAGMLVLPFLFEIGGPGEMSWAYLSTMADAPLAALFGGALSFYFAGGERDHKLLIPFGIILAALTGVKDIGLALACIAAFIAALDMLVYHRQEVCFYRLQGVPAAVAATVQNFAWVAASYLGWVLHVKTATGANRANIGARGESLGQMEMLVRGVKALLRIQPDAVFDDRAYKMGMAFFKRPLWLFGSAFAMLFLIAFILAVVWALSTDKHQQRRVVVFGFAMAFCCLAFYIFITFTYTYVFKAGESETLKDYHRYLYPFWFGWLMAGFTLLAVPANRVPARAARARGARAISLILVLSLLAGSALRFNWQANFANVSPALYGQRRSVQQVLQTAKEQGMQPGDVVYLISQGDDATRFYLFSYEMEETLVPLYGGEGSPEGTTAASLVPPGTTSGYKERVPCTPAQLLAYLKEKNCTHILLDVPDEYIFDEFKALFVGGFEGWSPDGLYRGGARYYKIENYGPQNSFVPALAPQGGESP